MSMNLHQTLEIICMQSAQMSQCRQLCKDKYPSSSKKQGNYGIRPEIPSFTTINVISRNEDTQLYGSILPVALTNEDIRNSESYKEYYAIASGKIPLKTKGSKKKQILDTTTKQKSPTIPKEKKEKKSGKGKQKAKELETISEANLTEAEQLKILTKRSRKETHISHASGSGADEGTGITPGVPDAPDYDSDDDISWKSKNDDDENVQDDDDEAQTESEDDGDDFIHPKLTTHDDEITHEEETDEDDTFDPIVHTPSRVSTSDDEDSDHEVEGGDVEGEKSDEDATDEEDEGNETDKDTNANLEERDDVMTDDILPQAQATQEIEDTHVTLTPVNPDGQQQSSSVSSGFVSNMLIPNQDTGVDAIFGQHAEATSQIDMPYDKIREESHTENQQFLDSIDEGMKKVIKEQVKKEVSKITSKIEKLVNEQLESEVRSTVQRQLYNDIDAYKADKILLDTYGDTVTIKRPRDGADDDQEPSAEQLWVQKEKPICSGKETMQTTDIFEAPAHQEFETCVYDKQVEEEVHHLPDWFQQPQRLPSPDHVWNKSVPAVHESVQPWLSNLARRQDPRSRHVILFHHFINNDLEYLRGGESSRKYSTSGVSHWGKKRRQFYAFAITRESARDIYSNRRIIAVTKVEIVEWQNNKHLDWGSLRVEDLQLGVESYQKKLNLTKPDTYRSNLRRKDAYTPYSDPRGFIYENKDKKNRLMRIDELHKFSDGTLDDVRTALNDRLKGIRMEYLPQTFWSQCIKVNARAMIQAIDKRLKTMRIFRSLERFVGGMTYGRLSATYKEHKIYHICSHLKRFNTTAGNPVKKILLKLNLSDHRLFKDGGGVKEFQRSFRHSDTERLSRSDEVLKLKNFKKDATLKLFKSTNQVRYEHVGPTITSSQDGKVNKMAKRDYAWLMISRQASNHAIKASLSTMPDNAQIIHVSIRVLGTCRGRKQKKTQRFEA
ncbi:hypothetical protein Tco_0677745 [Tanacetum coccineum]|uniref:Uncharacterized protein n=1 Tax=Tanacetum coccineum TaxID=301880 RepID=A0ABQ4XEF2_9ASTR